MTNAGEFLVPCSKDYPRCLHRPPVGVCSAVKASQCACHVSREPAAIDAVRAIAIAIEIDDHFDRLEFLKAWQLGDWAACAAFVEDERDRDPTPTPGGDA